MSSRGGIHILEDANHATTSSKIIKISTSSQNQHQTSRSVVQPKSHQNQQQEKNPSTNILEHSSALSDGGNSTTIRSNNSGDRSRNNNNKNSDSNNNSRNGRSPRRARLLTRAEKIARSREKMRQWEEKLDVCHDTVKNRRTERETVLDSSKQREMKSFDQHQKTMEERMEKAREVRRKHVDRFLIRTQKQATAADESLHQLRAEYYEREKQEVPGCEEEDENEQNEKREAGENNQPHHNVDHNYYYYSSTNEGDADETHHSRDVADHFHESSTRSSSRASAASSSSYQRRGSRRTVAVATISHTSTTSVPARSPIFKKKKRNKNKNKLNQSKGSSPSSTTPSPRKSPAMKSSETAMESTSPVIQDEALQKMLDEEREEATKMQHKQQEAYFYQHDFDENTSNHIPRPPPPRYTIRHKNNSSVLPAIAIRESGERLVQHRIRNRLDKEDLQLIYDDELDRHDQNRAEVNEDKYQRIMLKKMQFLAMQDEIRAKDEARQREIDEKHHTLMRQNEIAFKRAKDFMERRKNPLRARALDRYLQRRLGQLHSTTAANANTTPTVVAGAGSGGTNNTNQQGNMNNNSNNNNNNNAQTLLQLPNVHHPANVQHHDRRLSNQTSGSGGQVGGGGVGHEGSGSLLSKESLEQHHQNQMQKQQQKQERQQQKQQQQQQQHPKPPRPPAQPQPQTHQNNTNNNSGAAPRPNTQDRKVNATSRETRSSNFSL